MIELKRKNGIIHALDLTTKDSALEVAELVMQYIDAIKIGYQLVLATGLGVVDELKSLTKLPIIADFKIADIPETNEKILDHCFKAGIDAVIVHGFIGPDAVKACVDKAKEEKKGIFVVTEMTHPGGEIFTQLAAEDVTRMAKNLGADGVQAPGNRPERVKKIREIVGDEMLIVACGIGTQGGKIGGAIDAGATFEIIGRSIYLDPKPSEAAAKIASILSKKSQNEY